MLEGGVVASEAALKGEEVQAEHVEGRHAGCQEADRPKQGIGVEGLAKDLVFAPETGQRGNTTDGDATNEEGDRGDRHFLAQAAHQSHVLGEHRFMAHHIFHGVDDGS